MSTYVGFNKVKLHTTSIQIKYRSKTNIQMHIVFLPL